VIVSNFDAAFRVAASGLAVGIKPMLAGEQSGALRRIKLIPLADERMSRESAHERHADLPTSIGPRAGLWSGRSRSGKRTGPRQPGAGLAG
jgi:hypothetical protein